MIEVGEYVRTKKGIIGMFLKETLSYPEPSEWELKTKQRKIVIVECDDYPIKHSFNKIDLVEENDFVNGYICKNITDINTGEKHLCNFDLNTMEWTPLENIDIWESIVTHEQFKANEYRFEED